MRNRISCIWRILAYTGLRTVVVFGPSPSLRLLMVLKSVWFMRGWIRPYCSALRCGERSVTHTLASFSDATYMSSTFRKKFEITLCNISARWLLTFLTHLPSLFFWEMLQDDEVQDHKTKNIFFPLCTVSYYSYWFLSSTENSDWLTAVISFLR